MRVKSELQPGQAARGDKLTISEVLPEYLRAERCRHVQSRCAKPPRHDRAALSRAGRGRGTNRRSKRYRATFTCRAQHRKCCAAVTEVAALTSGKGSVAIRARRAFRISGIGRGATPNKPSTPPTTLPTAPPTTGRVVDHQAFRVFLDRPRRREARCGRHRATATPA
jgi:hypothetical protein